jgi:hypothetical protein
MMYIADRQTLYFIHISIHTLLFEQKKMRRTYILALLDSNGADIETIGLAMLITEVKNIDTTSTSGDKNVTRLWDLILDRFLFHDFNQGRTGRGLVPGMNTSSPHFIPAWYMWRH